MAISRDGYLAAKAKGLELEVNELKEISARLERLGYQLAGRTCAEGVSGLMMASAITQKIATSIEAPGNDERGEHGDGVGTVHTLHPER